MASLPNCVQATPITAITAPPVEAGPIRRTIPASTPTTTAAPITHGAVSGTSAPTVIPNAATHGLRPDVRRPRAVVAPADEAHRTGHPEVGDSAYRQVRDQQRPGEHEPGRHRGPQARPDTPGHGQRRQRRAQGGQAVERHGATVRSRRFPWITGDGLRDPRDTPYRATGTLTSTYGWPSPVNALTAR